MNFQQAYRTLSLQECGQILGLTKDQVRYKAKKMGLEKPKREPHNKKQIDIQELIEYYKQHTLEECSKKFGLSAHQLGERLKKSGLKTGIHYSKLGDEIIEDLKYMTTKECCKKYNCSLTAIRTVLRRNGIKDLRTKTDISKEELLDYYHSHTQKECSKHFGRSVNYIGNKLKEYGADTSIHFGNSFNDKISGIIKKRWCDGDYREKMVEVMSKINKVSTTQKLLYSALDELNVRYYREYDNKVADKQCIIGRFVFDCIIPLKDNRRLIIEVNGDYHHNKRSVMERDKEKYEYYDKYLRDRYDLKYIWEHEFLCYNKVVNKLKYWLSLDQEELINFSFDEISIRKVKSSEYKPFLSLYHYLNNPGRGGIVFGAYFGDKLIACCIFSQLIRQNVPEDNFTTREISRVCIHPKYRKKNFCSWFISKCIKNLPSEISTIISYADTTFNHSGAIYKACNFTMVSEVRPDYWYVDKDGFVMYKKCLYNKARNLKLTEAEFAVRFGYEKVTGLIKYKYVMKRK